MSAHSDQEIQSASFYTGLRVIILALFAVVMAIISVSFAANHMRHGFEEEYKSQMSVKTRELAAACALLIDGDELKADTTLAQNRYAAALPAMLVDSDEKNQSHKVYGLYAYTNGSLQPLLQSSNTGLTAVTIPISDWLTKDKTPYVIEKEHSVRVLTPIYDSQGDPTGLFELCLNYDFLDAYGNSVEHRVLLSVIVAAGAGIALFSFQFVVPAVIQLVRRKGERY
jgi:hypothetical protein